MFDILKLITFNREGSEKMKLTFEKETKKQLEKLAKNASKSNDLRMFRITKSLLLLVDGTPLESVADLFHVTVRTVYNWVKMFMTKRFAWLFGLHCKRMGRHLQ